MRQAIPTRVAQRAAERYTVVGEHWISTYSVASSGYAQVGWYDAEDGKNHVTTAHRAAWAHDFGDPGTDTVDHRNVVCTERRCVRRDHLRRLLNLENARRTSGRDWPLGECINGHDHVTNWVPKSEKNPKGYCRICTRDKAVRANRRRHLNPAH